LTKYLLILFYFIICSASCKVSHSIPSDYSEKITTKHQYQLFQGEPLSLKYGGVSSVKIIYDIRNDKIFFLNSHDYIYHFDFCHKKLFYPDDIALFNAENYKPHPNRLYVLANINYYSGLQIFTLEFSSSEIVSTDIVKLYNNLLPRFTIADTLYLYFATNEQLIDYALLHVTLPTIDANTLFAGLTYQPIVKRSCMGTLRIVSMDSLNKTTIKTNDILLINGSPFQVPTCQGIITTDFQAPLSHIAILSQNRKTPLLAYRDAWDNQLLKNFENKIIHLDVLQDTFYISMPSEEAYQNYLAAQNNIYYNIELNPDYSIKDILNVKDLDIRSVHYAGGKASNMGELNKVKVKNIPITLPQPSFAIPIYYYQEHILSHHIDTLINTLLSNTNQYDEKTTKKKLKTIRNAINNAPIDTWLLQAIENKISQYGHIKNWRFRSSTNAEDIDGFNGAGLYDSKTGIVSDSIKTIEKAIKKVWSSLWTDRAFAERSFFHIDHNKVAMAVLVHPSFGEEALNAVAITKNIYRPDYKGFVINIQLGELPVVGNQDTIQCEQFILYAESIDNNKSHIVEYLTHSSLQPNTPLLNTQQLDELYTVLLAIHNHYYYKVKMKNLKSYDEMALDVELKWIGEAKTLYVKQARIYND